jgi:phosphoenolpyruvate-protein phosphotransferase (PTS system enzyme I)
VFERRVVVCLNEGLHARPATEFVKLARAFASDIEVVRDGKSANAKSPVKLMLLGVKEDDEIVVRASGVDEAAAVDALCDFAGRDDTNALRGLPIQAPPPPPRPPEPYQISGATCMLPKGAPASAGAAIGPAFAYLPERIDAPRQVVAEADIPAELERLRDALAAIERELARRGAKVPSGSQGADIITALAEIGRDEELLSRIEAHVTLGFDAVSAALDVGAEFAREFEGLADPYMRGRGEDVSAYARNVALALLGKREPSLSEVPRGAIVLADELSAFDLAGASVENFGGLISLKGGATSHVAIIARSYGVPAVLGLDYDAERLRMATVVALDGSTGEVAVDPDGDTEAQFRSRIAETLARKERHTAFAKIEPRTRDGRLIEIGANLGSLKEVDAALQAGAMGVGLFRTELLFMERKRPPSEVEQATVYSKLAQAFAPQSVIVRTLDIGGDKSTPGILVPREDNPFLGWRGIRLCLDRPEIFRPQLRALLRAGVHRNLKVMIPMVADVEEIRQVKRVILDCRAELIAEGIDNGMFELGVMVETPAAALAADALALEAAFFSIGTNDLTQYVMAADRLNPRVGHLNRADHPAVLKAVSMICEAARAAGIWVGVCGEAAGRPDMIAKFVALGVTELSMSPASIPLAKKCVSEI